MAANQPEFWPGPMEGIAKAPFIRAVSRLNLADYLMTHFLRISAAVPPVRRIEEFLAPYLVSDLPVTLQLMGNSPELLGECCRISATLPVAGINLNAGCPSRRVTGHHAGGGLLRDLPLLREIISAMRENCGNKPLSVKLRCGWEHPEELSAIAGALQDCGLDKIFFHFRTVSEGYQEIAGRLERFKAAVSLFAPVPVILNGDIASPEELPTLLALGCRGIMSARSWLRDPWLLRRFAASKNTPLPDSETGRKIFFSELADSGVSGGNAIELAKLIFGPASPEFRTFLSEKKE